VKKAERLNNLLRNVMRPGFEPSVAAFHGPLDFASEIRAVVKQGENKNTMKRHYYITLAGSGPPTLKN
jgi:hypothetical protein